MEKETTNFNKIAKKEWLNNSLMDHFFIKMQIWNQKWPLIFQNILGLNMRYPLLMNGMGHIMVKYFLYR